MALVCALMLMLGALILGVSVARTAFASMASARQERERMMARAAAEAALADAQADLAGGAQPSSARAAWFAAGSGGFVTDCGRGSQDLGLCLPAAAPAPSLWERLDLAAEDSPVMVLYGRYTGATFASGAGILPARPPGYLIEQLVPAGPGPPATGALYRITAIGFGARANTRVVLQVLFRRPAPSAVPPERGGAGGPGADGDDDEGAGPSTDGAAGGGNAQPPADPEAEPAAEPPAAGSPAAGSPAAGSPAAGSPTGRIGWREIANWSELHARAMQ
jgi:type IV pilus assembly protein PilX